YAVAPDLQTYADGVRAGRKPIEGMRVSDTLQPLRNAVTAGIEVGALDVGALAALAPGADVAGALAPLLRQWQSAGLVALDGDVVRLTTAGRFWYSNLVFAFDAILCAGAAAPDAPRARPDLPSDPRKTREL